MDGEGRNRRNTHDIWNMTSIPQVKFSVDITAHLSKWLIRNKLLNGEKEEEQMGHFWMKKSTPLDSTVHSRRKHKHIRHTYSWMLVSGLCTNTLKLALPSSHTMMHWCTIYFWPKQKQSYTLCLLRSSAWTQGCVSHQGEPLDMHFDLLFHAQYTQANAQPNNIYGLGCYPQWRWEVKKLNCRGTAEQLRIFWKNLKKRHFDAGV